MVGILFNRLLLCSDHYAQRRETDGTAKQTLSQLYSIPSALPEELVNWLGTNLALNEA